MDMNLSVRCALVLFLLAFVDLKIVSAAETEGTSTAKPGVCPVRRWGMGICAELCSNDSDCPNDEKCCHNGCGHDCIAPYTAKPGVCPVRRWGMGICAELCSNDSDCPNDEKCCHNGCGHNCIAPYTAKPGVCPRRRWGMGMCVEFCSNDSDCPNNEKCCHNGCGHNCIAPTQTQDADQDDGPGDQEQTGHL
ncbi:WAP four-disulfide core domain protein 2-like [Oncorhynchus kisutch]|uniref:WAP four-disulfide core domain protein 2-like n=1 Tax=Oncorhynchus kisutch TaxID=8019 RepID=UPI0012DC039C|nr:WAP four-disulfide core domain protein 2-like [Oncorhynchus kisutch]